jgi:hypothetical protein
MYSEGENKTVLAGLSERNMGEGRGRERTREGKQLKQPIYIQIEQ